MVSPHRALRELLFLGGVLGGFPALAVRKGSDSGMRHPETLAALKNRRVEKIRANSSFLLQRRFSTIEPGIGRWVATVPRGEMPDAFWLSG